jgi:hypothetical protein
MKSRGMMRKAHVWRRRHAVEPVMPEMLDPQ